MVGPGEVGSYQDSEVFLLLAGGNGKIIYGICLGLSCIGCICSGSVVWRDSLALGCK